MTAEEHTEWNIKCTHKYKLEKRTYRIKRVPFKNFNSNLKSLKWKREKHNNRKDKHTKIQKKKKEEKHF